MKKFQSTIKQHVNNSIILPVDGRVEVDEKGQFEVSEECTEQIVSLPHFVLLGDTSEENIDSKKVLKEKKENLEKVKNSIRKTLLKTDMTILREIAEKSNLPEDEWGGVKNKLQFVKYLMDNIDKKELSEQCF